MRNKTLSAIVALSGLAAVAMPAGARVKKDETPLYKNASAPVEERVDDLLSRMTLEEKIMLFTPCFLMTSTRVRVPAILFS